MNNCVNVYKLENGIFTTIDNSQKNLQISIPLGNYVGYAGEVNLGVDSVIATDNTYLAFDVKKDNDGDNHRLYIHVKDILSIYSEDEPNGSSSIELPISDGTNNKVLNLQKLKDLPKNTDKPVESNNITTKYFNDTPFDRNRNRVGGATKKHLSKNAKTTRKVKHIKPIYTRR